MKGGGGEERGEGKGRKRRWPGEGRASEEWGTDTLLLLVQSILLCN